MSRFLSHNLHLEEISLLPLEPRNIYMENYRLNEKQNKTLFMLSFTLNAI